MTNNHPDLLPATLAGPLLHVGRPVPLERNAAAVYLARLAETGRRSMRGALAKCAHLLTADCGVAAARCECPLLLDWARVEYQHVAAVLALLQKEDLSVATLAKHTAALRGVTRESWRLGLMDAGTYERIRDVRAPSGTPAPRGRSLSPKERAALYAACAADRHPTIGARDACLIGLMDGLGLRRAAVVSLNVADVDLDAGTLKVRRGKGRKGRVVPLANGAAGATRDWLTVRGDEIGPLLWAVNKAGVLIPRRLSEQTVYDVLRKRVRQAGLKQCSPHDFRRTLVGDLLDAGADLAVVSALVGHSSVTTTAAYDRRGARAREAAMALRAVPYTSPKRTRPTRRETTEDE